MYKFLINYEKCIGCGICAEVCKTAKVYKLVDGKASAVFKEKCWECGQCIAACPKAAIKYNTIEKNEVKNLPDSINDIDAIEDLFRKRRSVRLFQNKTVSRKTVEEILDSTRWIPSAQNQCDVQWICIDDKEKLKYLSDKAVDVFKNTAGLLKNKALKQILKVALGNEKYKAAALNVESFENLVRRHDAGEDPIFYNAPVLLMTTTPINSYFGKENSIYASYNLMLYAAQKELATCRIGYFDVALERDKKLQEIILGKNSDRKIQTTVILGYSKYKFNNLVQREKINIKWN